MQTFGPAHWGFPMLMLDLVSIHLLSQMYSHRLWLLSHITQFTGTDTFGVNHYSWVMPAAKIFTVPQNFWVQIYCRQLWLFCHMHYWHCYLWRCLTIILKPCQLQWFCDAVLKGFWGWYLHIISGSTKLFCHQVMNWNQLLRWMA